MAHLRRDANLTPLRRARFQNGAIWALPHRDTSHAGVICTRLAQSPDGRPTPLCLELRAHDAPLIRC